jgi:negative regulator of flagellin synthesis FlgM
MSIGIRGDGTKINPINGKDKVQKAYKSENIQSTSKEDKITISENAKDYNTITKLLKDIPDVREDKVNYFTEKFDSGEYEVNVEDIANKLLEHFRQNND